MKKIVKRKYNGIRAIYHHEGTGLGIPINARGNQERMHKKGHKYLHLTGCKYCGPGRVFTVGAGFSNHMGAAHRMITETNLVESLLRAGSYLMERDTAYKYFPWIIVSNPDELTITLNNSPST